MLGPVNALWASRPAFSAAPIAPLRPAYGAHSRSPIPLHPSQKPYSKDRCDRRIQLRFKSCDEVVGVHILHDLFFMTATGRHCSFRCSLAKGSFQPPAPPGRIFKGLAESCNISVFCSCGSWCGPPSIAESAYFA